MTNKHTQEPWGWIVTRAMAEPSIERSKPKNGDYVFCDPLYTAPPASKSLTDELLEALEGLLDCAIYGFDMPSDHAYAVSARAAIAKAKGEA